MKRLLAALACVSLAHACVDLGGIGGTGISDGAACVDPGGIGGTGISDGGIGGTGVRAETELGVFGVITGFASICVNGIELHYDAATPVSLNGAPAQAGALAVGQVVMVQAVASSTWARAGAIHIVDAAVGVAAVRAEGLTVDGQRVRIEPATVMGAGLAPDQLAGRTLRVSGLRAADGTIVATRIDRAPAHGMAVAQAPDLGAGRFSVQGYVADVGQQDLRIGATSFDVSREMAGQLERDRLVRVSGRIEGGRRIVERADVLSRPLDSHPERTLRVEARSGHALGDPRGGSGSGRDGAERVDRSGPGGGDRPERTERSGRSERPDRVDRSGSGGGDRPERTERSGRSERPDRVDRSGKH